MAASLVTLSACYYDVEEVLYPPSDCVTENMSFLTDIVPVIQSNCYVCHSAAANTANITLEGHASISIYVQDGRLLGAIKHQSGFSAMPQNAPPLRACDIAKIESWIESGAPNN
jgi:hypothetical protein